MGMFFRASEGTWWLSSKKDPRWNFTSRELVAGVFSAERKCVQKIEELKLTLGEPPEDLEYGFMKD